MPTYQYACTECHDQFEIVQKFTDDALTECPHCTGRLRKVFSAVGVVFKGSGFYRTDSRSSNNAAISSTPSSDGASAASSSGDKATPAKSTGDGGSGAAASSPAPSSQVTRTTVKPSE